MGTREGVMIVEAASNHELDDLLLSGGDCRLLDCSRFEIVIERLCGFVGSDGKDNLSAILG